MKRYVGGEGMSSLARAFGIHRQTVGTIIDAANMPRRVRGKERLDMDEVRQRYGRAPSSPG